MAAVTLSMGLVSYRPRLSRVPIHPPPPPPLRYKIPAPRLRAMLHENSKKGGGGASSYDVFLSFHGRDVRHTIVAHLYAALVRKGVKAFKDDVEMPRGLDVKEAISAAIQGSSLYLLIISPGYASSEFCLDEAFEIMQRCRDGARVALPIFYHVSPDDVCLPTAGCFKEHFLAHSANFTYHRVQGWIHTLPWVGSIAGWVHENGRSEASLVDEVSTTIQKKSMEMGNCTSDPRPPLSALHLASSRSDHYDGQHMELEYFPPQISSTQGNDRIVRIPKPAHVDPLPVINQLCVAAQEFYLHSGRQRDIATITAEARSLWKDDRIELERLEMPTPPANIIGTSILMIRFLNQDTRNWVLESSPWLICGTQLFMRKWKGRSSSSSTVPMWVRLYNVPEEYMNPKGLSYIASALGKPMYVDRATADGFHHRSSRNNNIGTSHQIPPYAKVCVEINTEDHEPIIGFRPERTMVIAIGDEKENLVVVTAVYQQLEVRRYI